MRSINFDDGLKSFSINGDENRVIRFNPGDPNIRVRAEEAMKRLSKWKSNLKAIALKPDGKPAETDAEAVEVLKDFDNTLRQELNYIFNADIYDTVFAGQSPLCIVGNEKLFLFEAFLSSAMILVEEETEMFHRNSQAKIEKYIRGYKK